MVDGNNVECWRKHIKCFSCFSTFFRGRRKNYITCPRRRLNNALSRLELQRAQGALRLQPRSAGRVNWFLAQLQDQAFRWTTDAMINLVGLYIYTFIWFCMCIWIYIYIYNMYIYIHMCIYIYILYWWMAINLSWFGSCKEWGLQKSIDHRSRMTSLGPKFWPWTWSYLKCNRRNCCRNRRRIQSLQLLLKIIDFLYMGETHGNFWASLLGCKAVTLPVGLALEGLDGF